jgi:hypothetical protein
LKVRIGRVAEIMRGWKKQNRLSVEKSILAPETPAVLHSVGGFVDGQGQNVIKGIKKARSSEPVRSMKPKGHEHEHCKTTLSG